MQTTKTLINLSIPAPALNGEQIKPTLFNSEFIKYNPNIEFFTKTNEKDYENLPKSIKFISDQSEFMQQFPVDIPYPECSSLEQKEVFLIKNIDTGESYDLRQLETIEEINSKFKLLDKNNKIAWKSYWKEVKSKIEQIWDASELGDLLKLQSILSKSNNAYTLDINVRGLDNWTALHYACSEGHTNIVEFLLTQGADIEAKTTMERRPLHLAALRGHINVVIILIKNKCQLNPQDQDLFTPIHYASEHGFDDVVKKLLEHDVRIDLKNYQGMTAMDLCQDYSIREIFKEYDNLQDNNFGRTSYGNCIRTTSRADYVNKLLFLGNQLFLNKRNSHKKTYNKVIVKKIGPDAFDLYKLLGKGSFGEVYLVKERGKTKEYAMKVLLKDQVVNKNLTKYVTAERNVLSILNHPFMVKLHCAFQTIDKLFLVMEYCPGGDLERQLKLRKSYTEDETRIYLAEIILALESLHKGHIIYRDLKPANIVLDDDGHVRLTDFGLSKQGMENNSTNSFCGSIAYLAPEILLKQGHNRTVDWYLLGMLMYELLVGVPAYYTSNRQQLFENIIKGSLYLPKYLTNEAKDLITRLLCRTPTKRLGANLDAFEIKNHIWFKGIDWEKIYRKEIKTPVCFKPKKIKYGIPLQKNWKNDEETNEFGKLENWTVIIPDEESQSPLYNNCH